MLKHIFQYTITKSGESMKYLKAVISLHGVFFLTSIFAQPMIRSIKNNTPFMFTMIAHNDGLSDCSPVYGGKIITIDPFSTFTQPLLLGSEKPGLLLRPSGFFDKLNQKLYSFLDHNHDVDKKLLEQAFIAWQKARGKTYKKGLDVWFAQWLCGDISFVHNHVEYIGYMLNISIAKIDNSSRYHACTVDYSKGLFSRLIVEITIEEHPRKGIIPHVKSFVGQGGLCQDGQVVVL